MPGTALAEPDVAPDLSDSAQADGSMRNPLGRVLRFIEGKTGLVRAILFNLLTVVLMLLVVPIIILELVRERVTISAIAVPTALAERGLTGDVVANRLWDSWAGLTSDPDIAKTALDVVPSSQRIEFSIPDSGLSFESLIHHVRAFFGRNDTRIGGEIVCFADPCSLENARMRLRIIDSTIHAVDLPPPEAGREEAWYRLAVAEILKVIDPVRGVLVQTDRDPVTMVRALRRIAASRPEDAVWALTYAAQLMIDNGMVAEASRLAEEALARDPDFVDALVTLAAIQSAMADTAAARATMARVFSLTPDNARAHAWQSEIAQRDGNLAEALDHAARAADIDPERPAYRFRVGYLALRIGNPALAREAFEATLDRDPASIDAMEGLAMLALNEGDTARHLLLRKGMASLQPDNGVLKQSLAEAYLLAGQPSEALPILRQVLATEPGNRAAWISAGDAHFALGAAQQASDAYARAEALMPGDPGLARRRGEALVAANQTAAGLAILEALVKARPDSTEAALARMIINRETSK